MGPGLSTVECHDHPAHVGSVAGPGPVSRRVGTAHHSDLLFLRRLEMVGGAHPDMVVVASFVTEGT